VSPITHFLAAWTAAGAVGLRNRDAAIVAACGVLPDADGLGILVDGAQALLGRGPSWYYGEYHHLLLHGIFGAVVIPLAFLPFASDRVRTFFWGFLAVHLHLLCDLVGSRGPSPDDLWPLHYLAPFSERGTVVWGGQWPLNAWPNVVLTLALLGYAFYRAAVSGYSPVGVFSVRGDRAFVETVRRRVGTPEVE
jgi:membrane-bound metal-dependent hydrolase YbcI (DUF457 family)